MRNILNLYNDYIITSIIIIVINIEKWKKNGVRINRPS